MVSTTSSKDAQFIQAVGRAMELTNQALDKSRELQLKADESGYPSLDEIAAMSAAGFQYVISIDGLSGQFKPKKA